MAVGEYYSQRKIEGGQAICWGAETPKSSNMNGFSQQPLDLHLSQRVMPAKTGSRYITKSSTNNWHDHSNEIVDDMDRYNKESSKQNLLAFKTPICPTW